MNEFWSAYLYWDVRASNAMERKRKRNGGKRPCELYLDTKRLWNALLFCYLEMLLIFLLLRVCLVVVRSTSVCFGFRYLLLTLAICSRRFGERSILPFLLILLDMEVFL